MGGLPHMPPAPLAIGLSRFEARPALLSEVIDLMITFTNDREVFEPDPHPVPAMTDEEQGEIEWVGVSEAYQALEFAVRRQAEDGSEAVNPLRSVESVPRTGLPVATDLPPIYHSAIQRHLEVSFDLPPATDVFDFVPQPGQDRGLPALLQTKRWVAYLLYSLDARTYEPGIKMLSTAGVFPQRRISACLKSSRIPEEFSTEFHACGTGVS